MYQLKYKEAKEKWNLNNPTLKQKTIQGIGNEIGVAYQYFTQIDKRHSKRFNNTMTVVFLDDNKERINQRWNAFLKLNLPMFNTIELLRTILNCQIWDLVKKK